MDIKLYYTPRTRALRVRWLLEELELPYELITIDLFNGEGKTGVYRQVHPLGCVPAVEIDGQTMIESGAICEWLADQYPQKQLAPPINSSERMKYLQWMYFLSTTLEPPAWSSVLHARLLPPSKRIADIVPWSEAKFSQALSVIEKELENKAFLLDDKFTTVDILLTNLLSWLPKLVIPHAQTYDYMKRLMQREKYRLIQSQ
jgi:glutathione S-transferase